MDTEPPSSVPPHAAATSRPEINAAPHKALHMRILYITVIGSKRLCGIDRPMS